MNKDAVLELKNRVIKGSEDFYDYFKLLNYYKQKTDFLELFEFFKSISESSETKKYSKKTLSYIHYGIGFIYHKIEQYDMAIKSFFNAIELNIFDKYIYSKSVFSFHKTKEYQKAIDFFIKKINETDGKNENIFDALGIIYTFAGDYKNSIETLKKGFQINPTREKNCLPNPFSSLGTSYRSLKMFKEAAEAFKKAQEIENSTFNLNSIGYTYYALKEFERAIELHKKALSIKKSDIFALNSLGNCYKAIGEIKEAINYFNLGISTNPENSYSYYSLSEILIDMGDYENALQTIEKSLAQSSNPAIVEFITLLDQLFLIKNLKNIPISTIDRLIEITIEKLKSINIDKINKNTPFKDVFNHDIWGRIKAFTIVSVFKIFFTKSESIWKKYLNIAEEIDKSFSNSELNYSRDKLKLIHEIFQKIRETFYGNIDNIEHQGELLNLSMVYFIISTQLNDEISNIQEQLLEIETAKNRDKEIILQSFSHNLKNRIRSASSPLENYRDDFLQDGKNPPIEIEESLIEIKKIDKISNALNYSFKIDKESIKNDINIGESIYNIIISSFYNGVESIISENSFYPKIFELYCPTDDLEISILVGVKELIKERSFNSIVDFCNRYLFKLNLDIEPLKNFLIGDSNYSKTILSILFDEIILNIIKYSVGVSKESRFVDVLINIFEDSLIFVFKNSFKIRKNLQTTGMGVNIIKNIINGLGGSCLTTTDSFYEIKLTISNFWKI